MTSNPSIIKAQNAYNRGIKAVLENRWDRALPQFAAACHLEIQNTRYVLFLGAALWHTSQKDEALMVWSLGADRDPMIRIAQYHPQADHLTRQASQLADAQIRSFMTALQESAIADAAAPGRVRSAVWPQTHAGPISFRDAGPRPHMFYVPDLPDHPIFSRDEAPWTAQLERFTENIREEYLALAQDKSASAPYIAAKSHLGQEWNALKGQTEWSSFHLFQGGQRTESAEKCPVTCGALEHAQLVYHHGNPMEAFFSVLKPHTHIPPHHGLANCRLTVHLPLIIPSPCHIRVQKAVHDWVPGETFLFDDSFDHEAKNESNETRVVLIFEAWRPDMTAGEIDAVEKSYSKREGWLNARKFPNLDPLINGAT